MAWGKKLLLSLSVFAIMLLKRLPDGSKMSGQILRLMWIPLRSWQWVEISYCEKKMAIIILNSMN